jgi:DNA-binding transcriptional LysR family regulator
MDRFESLSAFIAVAEFGGFTAAARRLGMPLPTVSRKVSELEADLGVRLLNRTTRQVTLTDSGRRFFESGRRILDDLGEAERAASGEFAAPRGELVVTAPIVFGRLHVLPIVTEFLKAHADVAVRLVLADRVVDLLEERVDVAARIGELPDSGMAAIRVGEVHRLVCASPAYLAAHGRLTRPKQLAAHQCIAFAGVESAKEWRFRLGRTARAFPVRARLTVTTAEAAIDAAILGAGITRVFSYQAAQAVREGKLKVLLRDYEPAPIPVSLIHLSNRLVPAKLRAFLDFAVPKLKLRIMPV